MPRGLLGGRTACLMPLSFPDKTIMLPGQELQAMIE